MSLMDLPTSEDQKKFNILYVDDEAPNLRIFKFSFRRFYNIYTAESGEEALEIMKEHDIHLVITDQRMPTMTGVELLKLIIPKKPNMLRMIMTGFSDIAALEEAVNEIGINKYLKKPWDRNALKETLDQELEKHLRSVGISTPEAPTNSNSPKSDDKLVTAATFIQDTILKDSDYYEKFFPTNLLIRKSPFNTTNDLYWIGENNHHKFAIFVDTHTKGAVSGILTTAIHGLISDVIYGASHLSNAEDIFENIQQKMRDRMYEIGMRSHTSKSINISLFMMSRTSATFSHKTNSEGIMIIGKNGEIITDLSTNNGDLNDINRVFLFSDGVLSFSTGGIDIKTLLSDSSDLPFNVQSNFLNNQISNWTKEMNLRDSLTLFGFTP